MAAARSTGLRPIHFIHFIAATVTNRGPNLLGGPPSLQNCNVWQAKFQDDPDGKWNYEVFVKASGKESLFEVDPNGNFVKQHE